MAYSSLSTVFTAYILPPTFQCTNAPTIPCLLATQMFWMLIIWENLLHKWKTLNFYTKSACIDWKRTAVRNLQSWKGRSEHWSKESDKIFAIVDRQLSLLRGFSFERAFVSHKKKPEIIVLCWYVDGPQHQIENILKSGTRELVRCFRPWEGGEYIWTPGPFFPNSSTTLKFFLWWPL